MATRRKSYNNISNQTERIAKKIKSAYNKAKKVGDESRMKQLQKRLEKVFYTGDRYEWNSVGYMRATTDYQRTNPSRYGNSSNSARLPYEARTNDRNLVAYKGEEGAKKTLKASKVLARKEAARYLGAKVASNG